MTRPPIDFEPEIVDQVTAVVIPMDGVTRRVVTAGVDVELWDPLRDVALPHRLVRNLGGHHVLLNGVADADLTFRVSPGAAGYRDPALITFRPSTDGVSRVVSLERRPDADFDDVATLLRGQVRQGGAWVAGATVTATPPASAGYQFPATTDERGSFALAVHLDEPGPVGTPLRIDLPGGVVIDLVVDLQRGRTHVFSRPIVAEATQPPDFI